MKAALFNNLVESIKQAGQIRRGRVAASRTFRYSPMDIKAIRKRLHVSQSQFAHLIGVSVDTLQNWEQGRREPEGPAKVLLKIASQKPEVVLDVLHA